jgi:hypothetical protein
MKPTVFIGAILHIYWGIMLALDPAATWATPLSGLAFPVLGVIPSTIKAAIYLVAGFTGLLIWRGYIDRFNNKFWLGLCIPAWILIPQELLMINSAAASLTAAIGQQYADGVIRPFAFISADQALMVIVSLRHTWVMYLMAKSGGVR